MKIPYLLSLITWLPAVGAIIILAVFRKDQPRAVKRFATAWFLLVFLVSLTLLAYDRGAGGMQFLEDFEWIPPIGTREKEYYVLLLLLQAAVVGVFASMDLFLFYLFFEVSLVPMYFLIGIWGGERRLYAAIKFFLYTLVGSVVMLLGVLKVYFLTQDAALTAQITPATITSLAGNGAAADLVNNTVAAATAAGTGTFNILY